MLHMKTEQLVDLGDDRVLVGAVDGHLDLVASLRAKAQKLEPLGGFHRLLSLGHCDGVALGSLGQPGQQARAPDAESFVLNLIGKL